MTGVLASVNSHLQLVGQNRLELLLFRFSNHQLYGINVFKVREVIRCPKLSSIPKSNSNICGVANIEVSAFLFLTWPWPLGCPASRIGKRFYNTYGVQQPRSGFPGLCGRAHRQFELGRHPSTPKGSGENNYLTADAAG